MSKVVFVGDRVSSLPFRPLGVEILEAEDAGAASEQIGRVAHEGCAVLFVTEECAAWAEDALTALRSAALPAVCILPGVSSPGGQGLARLKRNVEKALGSDMVFKGADARPENETERKVRG